MADHLLAREAVAGQRRRVGLEVLEVDDRPAVAHRAQCDEGVGALEQGGAEDFALELERLAGGDLLVDVSKAGDERRHASVVVQDVVDRDGEGVDRPVGGARPDLGDQSTARGEVGVEGVAVAASAGLAELRQVVAHDVLGLVAELGRERGRRPPDDALEVDLDDDVRRVLREDPEALGQLVALGDVAPRQREEVAGPHGAHVEDPIGVRDVAVVAHRVDRDGLAGVVAVRQAREDPAGLVAGERLEETLADELRPGPTDVLEGGRVGVEDLEVVDSPAPVVGRAQHEERVQDRVDRLAEAGVGGRRLARDVRAGPEDGVRRTTNLRHGPPSRMSG